MQGIAVSRYWKNVLLLYTAVVGSERLRLRAGTFLEIRILWFLVLATTFENRYPSRDVWCNPPENGGGRQDHTQPGRYCFVRGCDCYLRGEQHPISDEFLHHADADVPLSF